MRQKTTPVFYGWYIAGIAFISYFLSVGTGFYAFNAFLEPLCELRGWTRTDVNLALVIGTIFGFISQYVYGTLLRVTGIRILMLFGSIVAGIAFIGFVRVEHLWQFYFFYSLLFIGNGAYGGIVASTVVNNWFINKRGKAIGFATAGMSLSGALLPICAFILINHVSLNSAAMVIGILIIFFGPLAWMIIRDWPEDLGLMPDGQQCKNPQEDESLSVHKSGQNASGTSLIEDKSWDFTDLLKSAVFWKVGLSFGLLMIGTVGVMSQLKPRFSELGYASTSAMGMMALTALLGTAGKYFWGILCDRFKPKYVATIMAISNIAGLSLALFKGSVMALICFIPVFGFSMGGIMAVYPIIVASIFGRKNFSAVLRYISIFLVLQLFGYIIAGQSFDRTGSYDIAYYMFIGFDIIAAALLYSIKDMN